MIMNSTKIAELAEIIAAVAVVFTLILLVMGIRENTQVMRATAHVTNLEGIIDLEQNLLNNETSLDLLTRFFNLNNHPAGLDNLDDKDAVRMDIILSMVFQNYEKAFIMNKYGVLGDDEWERYETKSCDNYRRVKIFEEHGGRKFNDLALTKEFVEYVEDTCD